MHANAEILLIRNDGALILQVRDDKPGITNPGLAATFGGHIEPGEQPIDAAVREINEETNLNLGPQDLTFYKKACKTKAVHGEDWDVYYFIATDIDDTGLEVYEGQGFIVVRNKQELAHVKLTTLLQETLQEYFVSPRIERGFDSRSGN